MRVRLSTVDLIGANRRVAFEPGLNIITGPISTGKTTLLRLCRALLSSSVDMSDFPREARERVVAVAGALILGDQDYSIVRPLKSTETAKIDIAGESGTWRLPANRADPTSPLTYGQWLLSVLGLPNLRVPSAPSQPASESTPVTINDYFMYCRLTQSEIDSSVFGHDNPYKNIKRKYVFEILYGVYDPEMASLQEELREVMARYRQLRAQTDAFQSFLEGTRWANRAELTRELERARNNLRTVESGSVDFATSNGSAMPADELRERLMALDQRRGEHLTRLAGEKRSIDQLVSLSGQLDSEMAKLTRSIVADSYLSDFEFLICPKCGTPVDLHRGQGAECSLCLQVPQNKSVDRNALIAEQDRMGAQLQETRQLISQHEQTVENLQRELATIDRLRIELLQELDFQTAAFVSSKASQIAESASLRTELKVRLEQLEDYSGLLQGLDRAFGNMQELEERRLAIESKLDAVGNAREGALERIRYLEQQFQNIIDRFRVPVIDGPVTASVDMRTYLPMLNGRRFDELSSQGLQVLVNVAYILANHRTSIALGLGLPQILFIDGLTSNLGHEGEDLFRVNSVYEYLMELSEELGESLQVVVADNDVPSSAREFVRLRLEESDRLIR